mmetsp:Transcript_24578/g.85444  ORF Transcript_24578/g.85444 Transcript_24578/m.85444 type:complete len:230 (+) Transcript_24578:675-1364(+)
MRGRAAHADGAAPAAVARIRHGGDPNDAGAHGDELHRQARSCESNAGSYAHRRGVPKRRHRHDAHAGGADDTRRRLVRPRRRARRAAARCRLRQCRHGGADGGCAPVDCGHARASGGGGSHDRVAVGRGRGGDKAVAGRVCAHSLAVATRPLRAAACRAGPVRGAAHAVRVGRGGARLERQVAADVDDAARAVPEGQRRRSGEDCVAVRAQGDGGSHRPPHPRDVVLRR